MQTMQVSIMLAVFLNKALVVLSGIANGVLTDVLKLMPHSLVLHSSTSVKAALCNIVWVAISLSCLIISTISLSGISTPQLLQEKHLYPFSGGITAIFGSRPCHRLSSDFMVALIFNFPLRRLSAMTITDKPFLPIHSMRVSCQNGWGDSCRNGWKN